MGSTRAGNSLEETETARDTQETQLRATYMLSEFGDSMRRGLSIAEIGPSVDTEGTIKQPRSLSLVEG